jgi:transposase-like protein
VEGWQQRSAVFRGNTRFADEIIALCVGWYLNFPLIYRDLEELMAERSLTVDHAKGLELGAELCPRLNRRVRRELKRTGTSWRNDEPYVRVAGRRVYLFRAADSSGATPDFYRSESRMRRLPAILR